MSFVLDGIASEDMGRILDQDGIAVAPGTIARSRRWIVLGLPPR